MNLKLSVQSLVIINNYVILMLPDSMAGLQNELRVKDDACNRLQQTRADLQEKLGDAIQQAETYKLVRPKLNNS